MAFGRLIADENPSALVDFVRLLARPIQSELMIDAAVKGDRSDVPCVDTLNFFWDGQQSYFGELKRTRRRRNGIEIRLDRDVVLPWPWHPGRLVRTLTSIGPGRPWGEWKVDKQNHGLLLWLPWGISFVAGGNHSITAGVISGSASLAPTEVYDMSGIFRLVQCDGIHYKSADGLIRIAEVTDPRVAAIFEIGRLMHRHKVSAW